MPVELQVLLASARIRVQRDVHFLHITERGEAPGGIPRIPLRGVRKSENDGAL